MHFPIANPSNFKHSSVRCQTGSSRPIELGDMTLGFKRRKAISEFTMTAKIILVHKGLETGQISNLVKTVCQVLSVPQEPSHTDYSNKY